MNFGNFSFIFNIYSISINYNFVRIIALQKKKMQEELEEEKQSLTASNGAAEDPVAESSPKNNKVDDDQVVDGVEEQPRNVFTIVDEDIGQLTV